MRSENRFAKKWRYGSASVALTAGVIAAVILVNVLIGALFADRLWFIDATSEAMYTLSDEAVDLLDETLQSADEGRAEDDPVQVDIIFCADPDLLRNNEKTRYVYYTALQMQKRFPDHIRVSTRDVWSNPSSVDAYRTNSYSSIYQSNIIVASGTEFRVYTPKSFYTYDTDSAADAEPWAYNAEKTFLSGIIAVTRAEAPICALTTNHGEPWNDETQKARYTAFLDILEGAGYEVVFLDLENEEIPPNCRLIITFDPQEDFASTFNGDAVSEPKKLEKYLEQAYSFMVFADADTPELPVMEEFLVEWGISFERYTQTDDAGETVTGNYQLIDADSSLDMEGLRIIAQYETEAMGGSLTKDMRETGGQPKVIFGNAISIGYSSPYETAYQLADEEAGTGAFTYGHYYRNNHSRDIYDVFRTSGETSFAYVLADGNRLTNADGEEIKVNYDTQNPFRLMTVTRESRTIGEGKGYTNINDASYVCAVGSTEFASNEALLSQSFGNTDILLATLRRIGREIEPVGLTFKPLYSDTAATTAYTTTGNTAWTIVLMAVPALTFATLGIVILVERRSRSGK